MLVPRMESFYHRRPQCLSTKHCVLSTAYWSQM